MPAASLSHALYHVEHPTLKQTATRHLNGLVKSSELILLQVLLLGWYLTC